MDAPAPQIPFSLTSVTRPAALKNRVYVAGPMTGIPEFNFPAFNAKAKELRDQGFQVVNPAEHGVHDWATWEDYLRYDLAQMATCGAIYFLPGWEKSKGARFESSIARMLKFEIMTDPDAVSPENLIQEIEESLAAQKAIIMALPADWSKDNSLETWFPLTAQQLAQKEQEIRELRAQVEDLLPRCQEHVSNTKIESLAKQYDVYNTPASIGFARAVLDAANTSLIISGVQRRGRDPLEPGAH